MKVGLFGINMGQEDASVTLPPLVSKLETAGLESVWTGEHVIIPEDYASRYPYNNTGKLGVSTETPFADPLITLSFIAAHTTKLRLGTGINILPQSNPMLLAKQVASLDHLSGGRLLLGLGVGWLAEEFKVMGAPFEGRGKRFDDYLAAMKKVWSGETVEHQSGYLDWSGFKSFPLPSQRPHPPIIIGGHSPAALRRTVAMGDGWFGFTSGVTELAETLGRLRAAADAAGRDPGSIEITALWREYEDGLAGMEPYADLGVSRLLLPFGTLAWGDLDENLERIQVEVLSKLTPST
ncbi:MAG: TIGR03619 family F420-dependent LLM class oxidoreductase [Alphaproteobacteria bacterium]|jgi:probable F420-dependent oxidoreductase|nr:TIGR03619 family F420-dependent LLM class oxidoreductase [Alphaproteobacteria bacterium]